MDALFRAVRKSPNVSKDQGTSKASKIPEGWGENKEPVIDGVTFYLKYIGSTLIEEKDINQTYGDGTSTKAIQNIITMAQNFESHPKQYSRLTVTPKGIRSLVSDNHYNHIFAYIARNTTNETMECHAFLCAKRKIAQAVTLTVSQAFSIAQERWLEGKRLRKSLREKAVMEKIQQWAVPITVRSSPEGSSQQQEVHHSDLRKNWESFEDSDSENIDDMFSRLAENRIRKFSNFGTDLIEDELDAGVQKYMEGSACFEAFSRTKSSEDLLNLF
ncbi:unnamed protein product [Candidula unifasciata]|uniref:PID domain-containing protein n=1 Tax=Candidula unifasciata TaxID=100452 RepID=A0A8S3YZ01_9EUPU|nr:unnamed protein product [Candidula unifasciata]